MYTRRNPGVPAKRRDPKSKQTFPPQGPHGAPLKIHRGEDSQQRRRCCPFVAIERVLFPISRFLLGDTPSHPSTPLLFRIRGYTPLLAPGLWDFMRAKAVYAPWISSDLLFSSYFNGNGCRTSTRGASRSNKRRHVDSERIVARFERGYECNNST